MNKTIIIGNLTRDPEYREVNGYACCTFTVAVNRRVKQGEHPQADFFRVTAWRKTAEICASYLLKGNKVCVEGVVRASAYVDNTGTPRASLELMAENVHFLTPRAQNGAPAPVSDDPEDFQEVDDGEVPF